MKLYNIPNELWQFNIFTYMSYTDIVKLIDSIEDSKQRIYFIRSESTNYVNGKNFIFLNFTVHFY